MLKANVGLSRKITRDYNSTGYSVNLEGEIPFLTDDAQGVLEKVRELFSLAQESLDVEIDRDQGEDAIGRRDEVRPTPSTNGTSLPAHSNGQHTPPRNTPAPQSPKPTQNQSPPTHQNGHSSNGTTDTATNKQVQFLLNMGKKFKLTTPQLEGRIQEVIGRRCGVYELTKKEAGLILDNLTKNNGNGQS